MDNIALEIWPEITVEGYSYSQNTALMAFNLNFANCDSFDQNIQFMVGKIWYGSYQLPKNSNFKIVIDIRGQELNIPSPLEIQKNLQDKIALFIKLDRITIQILQS